MWLDGGYPGSGSRLVERDNVIRLAGFQSPGSREMTDENQTKLLASGARIVTAGHAFSGVERAIRSKRDTVGPLELARGRIPRSLFSPLIRTTSLTCT
mgnify:CR=1 FL=1